MESLPVWQGPTRSNIKVAGPPFCGMEAIAALIDFGIAASVQDAAKSDAILYQ